MVALIKMPIVQLNESLSYEEYYSLFFCLPFGVLPRRSNIFLMISTPVMSDYRWFVGDGDRYQTQTVIHHYKLNGIYTAKLIVTLDKLCSSEHSEMVSITPTSAMQVKGVDMMV